MRTKLLAAAFAAALGTGLVATTLPAQAQEASLEHQDWPWLGIFGKYDVAQLKRGFQVYHEVCSNCHSLKLVAYRDLGTGLGLSDDEVKKIAAEKQVPDEPDDAGDIKPRPAKPSDHFVPPFPNDNAARAANNGALPPDLSLIVKARAGGPDYVYAILTGFVEAPKDFKMNPGMNYNKAFPGNQIGMPQPLHGDDVKFADGTKATLDQEAHDVVAFLNWAAEPELNVRHNLGVKVLIFAGILTILAYILKRKIWADVH
jgi:cytochrome c1